ncbi:methyltransferase domain-containing protein [Streptomyces sp. H10-C2]|uniref:class I SAM-dependent methyltransferase n=1 Tax=unclassified Streptomyces TaxID=2593676 RepID=UPI0024B9E704|nr:MULTISPECIES: class I SAM-dependent methyltransferase [unclassified Streptomyces]MDJ0344902.1 methyltransferase domain-containing protein [Streptomyces sp. PH10-H1]MDJ0373840.1 methyltransferase domain-containing protein [Streptomyces sp. H10-C2]
MRRTYRALYRLGIVPWDGTGIPAPLVDIVEGSPPLAPAQAVDLGCGTGCQARYLAGQGWSVTAVDYTPEAIAAARHGDPRGRVVWRVADVTEPHAVDPDGRLAGATSLLLDNGCLHGIPARRRPGWAATVNTLAAPGAILLVRAAPRQRRSIGPRGINAGEVTALLADRWQPVAAPGATWYRYVMTPSEVAPSVPS